MCRWPMGGNWAHAVLNATGGRTLAGLGETGLAVPPQPPPRIRRAQVPTPPRTPETEPKNVVETFWIDALQMKMTNAAGHPSTMKFRLRFSLEWRAGREEDNSVSIQRRTSRVF